MKDTVARYHQLIETAIGRQAYGQSPTTLYEPIRYLMGLGGKRLRPMLTLLAYGLYKNNPQKIVAQALAVETFHNFTLMHDDIMDKAPLRRGYPTVHEKWNVNAAILSGDVMLIKVYHILTSLDADTFKTVVVTLNKCATEVCEGQQWDMDFETQPHVTEQAYLRMIKLKTAVLLGFSLELGAILAGAPAEDRKALRTFGTEIGLGFQLTDDLLDAYADPKKFGKQVGGDIIANKKTYLLIKAFENATPKYKRALRHWTSLSKFNKREKVAAIKTIYDALGIPALTEKKINQHFKKGFNALEKLAIPAKKKETLTQFTQQLIERQS